MTTSNCSQNTDPLKLLREGTSQDQRFPDELDPANSPIDGRKTEHAMVFASAYAKFLQFYGSNNSVIGNWAAFFNQDVSVQLAVAAVQDVEYYKANLKASFDFLKDQQTASAADLKNNLGYLFSSAATLAKQLDVLQLGLPAEIPLKNTLQNMIQSQLAPAFKQLLVYYRDGVAASYLNDIESKASILGAKATFKTIKDQGLSQDWLAKDNPTDWANYMAYIATLPVTDVYGTGTTLFEHVNHIATHNLFGAVFDQFLKVYGRVVNEAKQALAASFNDWDKHEPHYALFLAFLKLFEYARAETNTLTKQHLDFYYRDILKLKEKPAQPGHAHLLLELAKLVDNDSHELKPGELFKAGKDDKGIDAYFASDRDLVANQAKVAALKTVYRHGDEPKDSKNNGRIYASPMADSDDGLGEKLNTVDESWHPFFNKIYQDGALKDIKMPKAELGFAIASHYLWMAEGSRTITVDFTLANAAPELSLTSNDDLVCLLTTEKGWLEIQDKTFTKGTGTLQLVLALTGAEPAITPYVVKTHGYGFATNLPVLLVTLRQLDGASYIYTLLQETVLTDIALTVDVKGLKSLAVSNDFGQIDISKPFQPFGATPIKGSSLIVGSNEVFTKVCAPLTINGQWQIKMTAYKTSPVAEVSLLSYGNWTTATNDDDFLTQDKGVITLSTTSAEITATPELVAGGFYNTSSRTGYMRIALSAGLGQAEYLVALRNYLIGQSKPSTTLTDPTPVPQIPTLGSITIDYTATQTLNLFAEPNAQIQFFHLDPFGQTEPHTVLNAKVYLLPQFIFSHDSEQAAELYIGITNLKPPQNLALLFQVVDGSANPAVKKPPAHIHWSYLCDNQWFDFVNTAVEDQTSGLINSGIINFSVPREAADNNTLLPAGMHWLRAAVATKTDAICRLQKVAAQALRVTFKDQGNDPAFPAKALAAGTISKLDQPDAAVKQISQPFSSFGGRGVEQPSAFYTRISERLRHKDRAIALWDYEHLILEAFPQIYKVKCLNHTYYEPSDDGKGIFKELAPGHVTVVAIPNQQFSNLRDPLRPFTSLGVLDDIAAFLRQRLSCFVELHVKNPQFEEVGSDFKVRFFDGYDVTFYQNKLQEAIIQFLSPWAFPNGGKPTFGGKVYRSVLINFIEAQPYVDYVSEFVLSHTYLMADALGVEHPSTESNPPSLVEVQASKAVSILVSAKQHKITVINAALTAVPGSTCACESS